MKSLVLGGVGLLAAVTLVSWPARAVAYPQWQLSTGEARCNQCHFAPAGGGLLTGYGRQVVGDDLSTFSGDGALLHGSAKVPNWLALGADLRAGYLTEVTPAATAATPPSFPMEAQAEALLVLGPVSVYGSLGMRGQLHDDTTLIPLQNYQPVATAWLVSREHWLMWQRPGRGLYLRAGRYYAPFGLRLAEPAAYVRRDLGFGELQESYNLSVGYVSDRWELHVTAFAPDLLRHFGSDETGGAAYAERRFGSARGALGAQVKYATSPGVRRTITGAVGKYYVAPIKTLVFAEADLVLLSVPQLVTRGQATAVLGAAVLPVRGVMVTVLGESYQEDLAVRGAARRAASARLGWFPYAHLEAEVMARAEFPSGAMTTTTWLAQLHYFL
jgi:hypothetical protein